MDIPLAVAIALAGALVGAGGLLAFRLSERERTVSPPRVEPPVLPSGISDVLAVLRSSAVVLDAGERVIKASPIAYAVGLVSGDRLTAEALLAMARRVRREGEILQAELELPRGPLGGETLAVSCRVAPLGAELVLLLVDDRTEARRIDAVRRDFVANVSHELKTPVGGLALLAEAIEHASDDPEAVRRFVTRMRAEATRLSALIQDLVDLSRLEASDPFREPARVPVDDVVEGALDRMRLSAQAKHIELAHGGERGLLVLGDATQLVMALGNLVENAVHYSPDHTRVAVGVRRAGDLVEITVTDQGIGIPEDDLDRVFERFYRVDRARSRATGGTGLGLSIVKHVAANHGGEVSVWSVEGSGSTFTLRLPLSGSAVASSPPRSPVQEARP